MGHFFRCFSVRGKFQTWFFFISKISRKKHDVPSVHMLKALKFKKRFKSNKHFWCSKRDTKAAGRPAGRAAGRPAGVVTYSGNVEYELRSLRSLANKYFNFHVSIFCIVLLFSITKTCKFVLRIAKMTSTIHCKSIWCDLKNSIFSKFWS